MAGIADRMAIDLDRAGLDQRFKTRAGQFGEVATVIGYRMFGSGPVVTTDDIIPLPKGARLISTSASAGRLAVLIEVDGVNELRTFDIKTLKQTGRPRFTREP